MARPCGPCSDKHRNELDRRLLEKEISGESFRRIAEDFGYSETALRRHLNEHLVISLEHVHLAKEQAKRDVLAEIKVAEIESTKDAIAKGQAAWIRASASLLDQLRDLRVEGWKILEAAKSDPRLALCAIQRLVQLLELQAEVEGKIRAGQLTVAIGQSISIYDSPAWSKVGDLLADVLAPYPDLRAEVAKGLFELSKGGQEQ